MIPRDPGSSTGANDEMVESTGTSFVMDPDAMDSKMSWGIVLGGITNG